MTAYSASLRDVAIGAGSVFPWEVSPVGFGGGQFTTRRQPRLWSDGSRPLGPDRAPDRRVTFSVAVLDSDNQPEIVSAQLEALEAAWAPVRDGVIPLSLEMADGEFVLFGRPVEAVSDVSLLPHGVARARLVFEATDPRMFAASESSLVLGLTAGGGFMFPLTFPLTFGAGGDSDGAALNAGTFETDWTATIVGPVTTPRITLGSTGEFVELDGTVPDGSSLTVMSVDGAVLLNGSPRQSWVTLPSTFFKLPAGSNTIRFRAASGTGTCTFSWRSAWL